MVQIMQNFVCTTDAQTWMRVSPDAQTFSATAKSKNTIYMTLYAENTVSSPVTILIHHAEDTAGCHDDGKRCAMPVHTNVRAGKEEHGEEHSEDYTCMPLTLAAVKRPSGCHEDAFRRFA